MANRTSGRVNIPKNPADLLEVARKIYDKHKLDGAKSPLNAMLDYNWNVDGPKIATCKKSHEDAEAAARKAEQHYRQRDLDLKAIEGIVRNSAALLKTVYAKNPKALGDYGFEIDDTPHKE